MSSLKTNPKFTIENLTPVVVDLLARDKRALVFEILDTYFKRATTIGDFDTLGDLAQKSEHRELYLKCAEAAYAKAEDSTQLYIARCNLYKAYNVMNQPEKALFYIDLNLSVNPDDFESLTQKAFNIALLGDRATSEKILLDLVDKYPERANDMKSALSGKLLREGKLAEGVVAFLEAFKPSSALFDDTLRMTRWTGVIQPGRTIYVEGEGGLGDEIINIRFFKHIRDLGMTPILYSTWLSYRQDTVDLFRRHGFEVITDTFTVDRTQLWAPMMSLPGYLNLDESKLWYGPYLTPLRNPNNRISSDKFKIGIKCSGNPYFAQDEYRKIPLDQMLSYIPDGCEVYYIDKTTGHPGCVNLGDRINNWEDTLDFIDQMDCIVSSCTSLVHAAGAMGKTTFVAVPIAEYYIWSTSRRDTSSPWYGENFQVHKQTKVRSWDEPLNAIRNELLKLMENKQ